MAVRKRGSTWQIDYIDPSGKRIRKAFKLKKDATDEYAKRISLIGEKRYLDVKKECVTTFGELLQKYEDNFQHQRGFKGSKKFCLKNFKEHFKSETILANIRYVDIETYKNHLRQKRTVKDTIRKDASINRELSCLRNLFTKAVEWEMIEQNPFKKGKSLLEKENNTRVRFLTEEEIPLLLGSCSPHLRDIVVCALNTGMRRGEILNLRWDQVRNGFIYLQKTKTNTSRQIPVNNDLGELFKRISKAQKVGAEYVFTFTRNAKKKKIGALVLINSEQGNRINSVKVSFAAALRRSGIKDFRFHDLRHTFASHFVMRGGTLKDLQEILGHTTMTMTLRYAHLSQDHKKKAVNLLNGLTALDNKAVEDGMSQNVTKPDFDPSCETHQSANCL
ncbi:MAG: site-specific integrase [Syntrophales bacterium]